MRGVDDKACAVVIFNVIKDNLKTAFFPFSIFFYSGHEWRDTTNDKTYKQK